MNESPNVLVLLRYHAKGGKDRDFYSSKDEGTSHDFLNYVDTGSKDGVPKDYVAYAGNPEKSQGVFNEKGLLTQEGKKKLREELRSTDSIIWDMVISLSERFGEGKFVDWKECQELLSKVLPPFFKECRLSPENMECFAGLHENTDNRHIHLSFFEKRPDHIDTKTNKAVFRRKGKLPKGAIDSLLVNIERTLCEKEFSLKRESLALRHELESVGESLPDDLRRGLKMRRLLKKLYNELPKEKRGYASKEMQPHKAAIDAVSLLVLDAHPELKRRFLDYYEKMRKADEKTLAILKRDKLKADASKYLIAERGKDDFFRRLGNKVLGHVYESRKQLMSEEYKLSKDRRMRWAEKRRKSFLFKKAVDLDRKVSEEAIDAFEEFEKLMAKAEYEILVEQGMIESG